jgi:hypothetical protein
MAVGLLPTKVLILLFCANPPTFEERKNKKEITLPKLFLPLIFSFKKPNCSSQQSYTKNYLLTNHGSNARIIISFLLLFFCLR